MKNIKFILTTMVGLMLLASACSPATPTTAPTDVPTEVMASDTPAATETMAVTDTVAATETVAPSETVAATEVTTPANLATGTNATLGSFLVDGNGRSLYLYTKDTPNTSVCYDKCATAWPPLLTKGAPVAGTGVDATLLGTTNRTDGTVQVTYKGWPLYYYEKDTAAGDVTGQGVGEVWYVVAPDGGQNTTPMP
jgi:predicted lipoprotein with Yx(FWY)xxD motif